MNNQSVTTNRLQNLFANRDKENKVMSLFITAGYPEKETTVDLILGMEQNGAELIELGMPYSDPLADGPTIQHASTIAIKNGVTIDSIFDMVGRLRQQSDIPLVLMGYLNPILRYGIREFCQKASSAGVDGLIVADIPVEETGIIKPHTDANNLDLIYLVAPNTPAERMQIIDGQSSGFVYCVSVTGVTGARGGKEVAQSVSSFIERVNANIKRNPKMVGFGIKSYEDAQQIARRADGFIVGSALINTIREYYPKAEWKQAVFDFVNRLKYGNP